MIFDKDPIQIVFGNTLRQNPTYINSPLISGESSYLGNEHRARKCLFPKTEEIEIQCDLLDGRVIDTVAISNHNLSIDAVIIYELLSFNGTVLSTGGRQVPGEVLQIPIGTEWRVGIDVFDPRPIGLDGIPETYTDTLPEYEGNADFLRIRISDPENTNENIQIGMIFAGSRTKLKKSFDWGNEIKPLTDGEITETFAGHALRSKLRRNVKAWTFSLAGMDDEDKALLMDGDKRYPNEPVLVSGFPNVDNKLNSDLYNFIGLMSSSPVYNQIFDDLNSTTISLAEV